MEKTGILRKAGKKGQQTREELKGCEMDLREMGLTALHTLVKVVEPEAIRI